MGPSTVGVVGSAATAAMGKDTAARKGISRLSDRNTFKSPPNRSNTV
jgi:hypothetical protein